MSSTREAAIGNSMWCSLPLELQQDLSERWYDSSVDEAFDNWVYFLRKGIHTIPKGHSDRRWAAWTLKDVLNYGRKESEIPVTWNCPHVASLPTAQDPRVHLEFSYDPNERTYVIKDVYVKEPQLPEEGSDEGTLVWDAMVRVPETVLLALCDLRTMPRKEVKASAPAWTTESLNTLASTRDLKFEVYRKAAQRLLNAPEEVLALQKSIGRSR